MIAYFESKKEAAQFAEDLEKTFPGTSPLTMITLQGKYAVSYALSAIASLSDDTEQEQVAKFFSETQVNI